MKQQSLPKTRVEYSRLFLLAALVLTGSLLFAQSPTPGPTGPKSSGSPAVAADPAQPERIWAPFVSKLRIAVKEPQIRLTWQDIDQFIGIYLVFRSEKAIDVDTIKDAQKVAEIRQGEEFYGDVPPKSGSYHYAILAQDQTGRRYDIFIPFRNVTISPVVINTEITQRDLSTSLTNLAAKVKNYAIEVSVLSSRNNRTVNLYRSTQAIRSREDVAKAVHLTSTSGRQILFTDYAVPGIPYYYAAVDSEAFGEQAFDLQAGVNTLTEAVEIAIASENLIPPGAVPRQSRVLPLPVLTLPDLYGTNQETDFNLASLKKRDLDPVTLNRLAKLRSSLRSGQPGLRNPELLPSDALILSGKLDMPKTGDPKVFAEILTKHFQTGNWDETISLLGKFLTLPLSREMETKARYYLGQALYHAGKYREALLEFLVIQDQLGDFTQDWIKNTLELSASW